VAQPIEDRHLETPSGDRALPSGLLMAATSVTITAISLCAWLLVTFGATFGTDPNVSLICSGLALPAVTLGSIGTHMSGRRIYFWLGFAITLIPLAAFIFLTATSPPPTDAWRD
jgi:hypothetical protein